MKSLTLFDRRYFLKLAGAAPLLAYIAVRDAAEKALGAVSRTAKPKFQHVFDASD